MANKYAKSNDQATTKTEIVVGAPVKITRAQAGSRGKDTRVEFVQRPDGENWLDINMLNESSTLHNTRTGYDRWVERTGRSLENIEKAEDASLLPEMLAHEDPLVQETAENKLRELKSRQTKLEELENEEHPKVSGERKKRFDALDMSEEDKE